MNEERRIAIGRATRSLAHSLTHSLIQTLILCTSTVALRTLHASSAALSGTTTMGSFCKSVADMSSREHNMRVARGVCTVSDSERASERVINQSFIHSFIHSSALVASARAPPTHPSKFTHIHTLFGLYHHWRSMFHGPNCLLRWRERRDHTCSVLFIMLCCALLCIATQRGRVLRSG